MKALVGLTWVGWLACVAGTVAGEQPTERTMVSVPWRSEPVLQERVGHGRIPKRSARLVEPPVKIVHAVAELCVTPHLLHNEPARILLTSDRP